MKTAVDFAGKVKSYTVAAKSIAPVENGTTSAGSYAVGEQFMRDGALCRAKTPISAGTTLTLNTNYEVDDTVVAQLSSLKNRVASLESEVSWLEIVNDIKSGNLSGYAIGDLITDPWKDASSSVFYDNPWRINHFESCEIEGGETVNGMWLQNKYAHPFGVQFSHSRAFLKCPDGLAAGTYYFTIESSWGTHVSAGDIVCFTLANAVPEGGRVAGCYSAPDSPKANWRVYAYSADGKTVLETVTPTFTASGIDLGTMKANTRNGNLNSMQETAYGWNRWSKSALRQYLNSDAGIGLWWTAQDAWDIAPDQLTTKAGFLSGLSEGLKEILLPVKTITYVNTVQDGGTDDYDITYDKVTLISKQQMYANPQHTGEGEAQDYWKQLNGTATPFADYPTTYPELIQYAVENHSSAQNVRLRSAHRGFAIHAWYVHSGGYVSNAYASTALRFEPLVFIG